jgi:SAM-dependent methyltransferase
MDEHDFGERYFQHDCGRPYQHDDFWRGFFGRIADVIVSELRPRRVLDAGCAMGFLVEALRARGVEACGFDLSSYALAHAPAGARAHCWLANVTDEIAGRYDLIVCQEVLPHVPLAEAEAAIANFCRHSDDVLFSVSPYGPAPLHRNLQPPEYWAGVFARHGFYRDFDFDGGVITAWAVRYRKALYPTDDLVSRYEQRLLALRTERDQERARREYAEARMQDMEQRWLWKARRLWQRIRARTKLTAGLGRSGRSA